jgi:hypothetical protein
MDTLKVFLGKNVNVFGAPRADGDDFLDCGYVTDIENGFLFLSDEESGQPKIAINLRQVTVIAIADPNPDLKPLPGGKIHRFKAPQDE